MSNGYRVYISGPIVHGDLQHNIQQATDAFIMLAKAGFDPMCPHWSCFSGPVIRFPDDANKCCAVADILPNDIPLHRWMEIDLNWVRCSDAVLRLPGFGRGSDREVTEAFIRGIPVFYTIQSLMDWAGRKKC